MRIAVAQILQETNTFSPIPTTLETFRRYYYLKGEKMLDGLEGQRIEIPGILAVLRSSNAQVVPLIATSACASGTLTRETYETIVGDLMERLKGAGKLDGVILALHGAMAAEGEDDPDGAIIEMVRKEVGPDVPIGVSFDLHALVTRRMLQPNTFLLGYKEYPHIDMFETGERIAQLMLDKLAGKKKPVMSLVKTWAAFCARTHSFDAQGISVPAGTGTTYSRNVDSPTLTVRKRGESCLRATSITAASTGILRPP